MKPQDENVRQRAREQLEPHVDARERRAARER
jgi:hypothetical protein